LKSPPALDGTDAGWSDVVGHDIPATSLAEGRTRDAADSSARFRLAHDGKTMFVEVDVTDDVVVSNIAPDDIRGHWRSDSVEICVDPAGGAEHTLGCFKVGIFPFDTTGAVRAARDADANQGPIEETAPATRVVSKRTATGYRVRVAIPLSEMRIDPATGGRVGFNVIVYDGDKRDAAPGENINKSRIAWSPRAGVQGRPEDWGRIEFAAGMEAPSSERGDAGASDWKNPLVKKGYLNSPLVETTPFAFGDRLYLAENYQAFVDSASKRPGDDSDKDALRIRDVETGKIVSVALREHSFGTVFVSGDRVYAFSAKNAKGKPWRTATSVSMTYSTDLRSWSEPRMVLEAEGAEQIFNVAVCRGVDRFVLLYETNDPKYPPFTFKYCESDDLVHWRRIPGALYGTDKYVGGPALYYEGDREGGWYYTLYLEALPDTEYETRITRSRDLKHWQDAPPGRPFLTFDRTKKKLPLRPPELPEKNASDAELCYFKGRTIVYFTGSDQQVAGDLQRAEYEGTPRELFEHFFEGVAEPAHEQQ
jgi:hypothetical protein